VHFHHAFLPDEVVTELGRNSAPFRSGSHCAAMSGRSVAKSVSPGIARLPAQAGQPEPSFDRFAIDATQPWPALHFQMMLRDERGLT
jgi:hypothetical protein